MATCTLELYQDTKLRPEKNYLFHGGISYFLASKTKTTVTDFQWQRPELEKKIKLNLAQSYSTIAYYNTKFDYLRIKYDEYGTEYYYFIIKYTQVAENTIELSLTMDTLNTFSYNPVGSGISLGNKNYRLSPKTLIKRQHKDRFEEGIIYFGGTYFSTEDTPEIDYEYIISVQLYMDKYPSSPTDFIFGTPSKPSQYSFSVVDSRGVYSDLYMGKNQLRLQDTNDGISLTYWDNDGVGHTMHLDPNEYIALSVLSYHEDLETYVINNLYELQSQYDGAFGFKRKIDKYNENINTILFKKTEYTLYDSNQSNQWYIVFSSANAVVASSSDTAATYVNPLRCRFYSDYGYTISTKSKVEKRIYATDPLIPKKNEATEALRILPEGTVTALGQEYVVVNGVTYDFFDDFRYMTAVRKRNNDNYFSEIKVYDSNGDLKASYTNIEYFDIYGVNYIECDFGGTIIPWAKQQLYVGSGENSTTLTSPAWSDVDLTDPKLIKAYAFPYTPLKQLVGSSFNFVPDNCVVADGTLELNKIQNAAFNYQLKFDVAQYNPQYELLKPLYVENLSDNQDRIINIESKLFHSDFYQPKFVYDSFSFTFYLENVDIQTWIDNFDRYTLYVTYVISRNLVSKFAFIFDTYICDRSIQDYEKVLCIERNNEKALYNNAYINYVKSGGYSYDTKKASTQNAVNGVTSALSIIGSIASFASTPATGAVGIAGGVGLAVTASTAIIRGIHTAQEQDRSISQKLNQAVIQGTSVQGSEDVDILTIINDNKAKIVFYELSDIMKSAVYDLFYFCGYATNENGIPNIDSRILFNYVQAEIQYSHCGFDLVFAEDIKNKWAQGVTFIHKNASNVYYDPEALKENWESFFFEEVE